jgi:hypothetical protein
MIINRRSDPQYRLTGFVPDSRQIPRMRVAELPSRLLRARFETVDFVGRETELEMLADWCAEPDDLSVLLVHGPGGQGKTRLLRQFATKQSKVGWGVWQARHQMDTEALGDTEISRAAPGENGLLVIIDYAERWPKADLEALVKDPELRSGTGPVRLLLAARPAGIWWRSFQNWLREELEVQAMPIELSPLGRQISRWDLYTSALRSFAEILDVSDIEGLDPPADFDNEEGFELVLAVHMAALAAVDARAHGVTAPADLARISAYLLQREYSHWEKLKSHSGDRVSTSPQVMGRAVFTATLTGPLSGDLRWDEAIDILQATRVATSPDVASAVLTDYDLCYPCATDDMVLQPLYPDLLGEDFIALAMPGHGLEHDHPSDAWAAGVTTRLFISDTAPKPSPARMRTAVTVLVLQPHLEIMDSALIVEPAGASLMAAAPA